MIAIFHSLPQISEIKRNFLFFDEIQTSEKFIRTNLEMILKQKGSYKTPDAIEDFIREFDYLIENGIIKPKEDIELRLIPDIGSFDSYSMERHLRRNITNKNSGQDEHLANFFKRILEIKMRFGIEIIGDINFLTLGPVQRSDEEFINSSFNQAIKHPDKLVFFINEFSSIYSRFASIVLNEHFRENNYYPLVAPTNYLKSYYDSKRDDDWRVETLKSKVVNLIINKMPVPDDSVSWDQLKNFKSDPDSKKKLLGLRTWIAEISQKQFSLSEISEKLEYLLEEYSAQMKNHKLKYTLSSLETVLVPTLEVLENLIKFKFSKAAKVLFDLKRNQFQLLEAEAKFPGREIAYLYKTQDFL